VIQHRDQVGRNRLALAACKLVRGPLQQLHIAGQGTKADTLVSPGFPVWFPRGTRCAAGHSRGVMRRLRGEETYETRRTNVALARAGRGGQRQTLWFPRSTPTITTSIGVEASEQFQYELHIEHSGKFSPKCCRVSPCTTERTFEQRVARFRRDVP
jgi:hypothetical protein